MCGRFTLRTQASVVAQEFGLLEAAAFAPRFNVAPSQPVAVVRRAPPDDRQPAERDASGGQRQFAWLRWGLVPSWAGDAAIGNRLINARAETAAEKGAFRGFRTAAVWLWPMVFTNGSESAIANSLVSPASNRPFAFAGLGRHGKGRTSRVLNRALCCNVTNELSPADSPIGCRRSLPRPTTRNGWTRQWRTLERLASLLGPYPSEAMAAYPVGSRVNNPGNDNPGCIEPAAG